MGCWCHRCAYKHGRVEPLNFLDEIVGLVRRILNDQNIDWVSVDCDLFQIENWKPGLKEFVCVVAEQSSDICLGFSTRILGYWMKRKVFIINAEYQKSVAPMFSVGETQNVVDQLPFSAVMLAFEVPIRAFCSSIDKHRDDFM